MQIVPQSDYAKALFRHEAGLATDKKVSSAVMLSIGDLLSSATDVPATEAQDVDPVKIDHKPDTKSAITDAQRVFNAQDPGSISLVLLGEAHNNQQDQDRARDFIDVINHEDLTPTLFV